jgi:hypothetical protein
MPDFQGRPGLMAGPPGGPGLAGSMSPMGSLGAPGAGGPDLTQMIERMPAARLEDFRLGETVIVSSTRGEARDELTAIVMLGNAARLVEMAAAQQQRQGGLIGVQGGGMGAGMSGSALGGLELPGMLP